MLATTFWEEPFAGLFGNPWCLSCWCLGGLSIVFRWSLVSCGMWWRVRSVLRVFGDGLGVLFMFWWCFCGVSALFRCCLVGIEGMAFA